MLVHVGYYLMERTETVLTSLDSYTRLTVGVCCASPLKCFAYCLLSTRCRHRSSNTSSPSANYSTDGIVTSADSKTNPKFRRLASLAYKYATVLNLWSGQHITLGCLGRFDNARYTTNTI